MADLARGVRAGLVAGVSWGAILGIVVAVIFQLPPIGVLIFGILVFLGLTGGLILGPNFAGVADKFTKGRSYAVKGVVFGLCLWIIDLVLYPGGYSNLGGILVGSNFRLAENLVGSVIFGIILGYSYERFAPRSSQSPYQGQMRGPEAPPMA